MREWILRRQAHRGPAGHDRVVDVTGPVLDPAQHGSSSATATVEHNPSPGLPERVPEVVAIVEEERESGVHVGDIRRCGKQPGVVTVGRGVSVVEHVLLRSRQAHRGLRLTGGRRWSPTPSRRRGARDGE